MVDAFELAHHDARDVRLVPRRKMREGHLHRAADALTIILDEHVWQHPACHIGVALAALAVEYPTRGKVEASEDGHSMRHVLRPAVRAEIDHSCTLLRPPSQRGDRRADRHVGGILQNSRIPPQDLLHALLDQVAKAGPVHDRRPMQEHENLHVDASPSTDPIAAPLSPPPGASLCEHSLVTSGAMLGMTRRTLPSVSTTGRETCAQTVRDSPGSASGKDSRFNTSDNRGRRVCAYAQRHHASPAGWRPGHAGTMYALGSSTTEDHTCDQDCCCRRHPASVEYLYWCSSLNPDALKSWPSHAPVSPRRGPASGPPITHFLVAGSSPIVPTPKSCRSPGR